MYEKRKFYFVTVWEVVELVCNTCTHDSQSALCGHYFCVFKLCKIYPAIKFFSLLNGQGDFIGISQQNTDMH